MTSVVIFLNKNAIILDDLFLNEKWDLCKLYDNIYLIKVRNIELEWLVKTYKNKKYVTRESKNLNTLKNTDGIPKILVTGISEKLNYIILSKQKGLDLFDYVEKHGVFSEYNIKNLIIQLLEILKKIHKKNIIHGDIKPENIIYDNIREKINLIDFEGKHTEDYCSPEQANKIKVTNKTDSWSLGVTIYRIIVGNKLFESYNDINNKQINFPKKWSDKFKDFMYCLIERDVNSRYTISQSLNHEWLQ
jgi:serine/threonine protein kinase